MGAFVRGLGVVGVALLLGACASSTRFGSSSSNLEEVPLPDREAEGLDAGAPSPASPRTTPSTDDAATPPGTPDAGTDAAPTRSAFCSASDVVVCFEFENAVRDSSINALDPTTVAGVSYVPGKAGLAAEVGAQSTIVFDYSPMWNTDEATIEAWVKLSTNGSSGGVIFDSDDRFAMEIEDDGSLKCKAAGGSETGGKVVKGEYTHVACTFASTSKIRNYVGGLERANGSGKIAMSNTGGAALGSNAPSGEAFTGAIDSLRLFRTVRTATDIAQAAQ